MAATTGPDRTLIALVGDNQDRGDIIRQNLAVKALEFPYHFSTIVSNDGVLEGGFGNDKLYLDGSETITTRGGRDEIIVPRVPNASATILDFTEQQVDLRVFSELTSLADLVITTGRTGLAQAQLPNNQTLLFAGSPTLEEKHFIFTRNTGGSAPAGSVEDPSSSTEAIEHSSDTGLSGSGLFSSGSSASPTVSATDLGFFATGLSMSGTGILGPGATGSTGPTDPSQISNNSAASFLKSPAILGSATAVILVFLACLIRYCVRHDKKQPSSAPRQQSTLS